MAINSEGWLSGDEATKIPTDAYNDRNRGRSVIVMHYTASYNASSAINTFKNRRNSVSAHFIVDVDGAITQMVSTEKRAWHAGASRHKGRSNVNDFSVGIEIVNPGHMKSDGNGGYIDGYGRGASAGKLAAFGPMIEASDARVGSARLFWPSYPEAQLDAVEELTRKIITRYPSVSDITGHRDIDTRGWKVDPGPAFPMLRFRKLIDDRRSPRGALGPMKVSVKSGTLNVRGGPSQNYDTLDWGPLEHKTFVDAIEEQGDWYKIVRWIDGKKYTGWVHGAYLVPR